MVTESQKDELRRQFMSKAEEEHTLLREQAEVLRAEILDAERRLDTLLDLFLESASDEAMARYRHKEKELETLIKEKEVELIQIQSQLSQTIPSENDKAQLREFCDEISKGLENVTIEDKQQVLLILDVHVTYYADRKTLLVQGAFPTQELDVSQR